MKALVTLGPGKQALIEPTRRGVTAPTDTNVRTTKTTIFGTDLHMPKSDVPSWPPGRIRGREGVDVIESVGAGAQ